MTRNRQRVTGTYPEIAGALRVQDATDFIIDGEVVAFDGEQTSFSRLQRRLGVSDPGPALLAEVPVYIYLFDVLWAGGRDVRPRPLLERKALLRDLLSFGDPLRFTEHRDRDGQAYYAEACRLGWDKDPADVVRETPLRDQRLRHVLDGNNGERPSQPVAQLLGLGAFPDLRPARAQSDPFLPLRRDQFPSGDACRRKCDAGRAEPCLSDDGFRRRVPP